ncbi:YbhB/YbcL family Raf kinase inhibitor-like protein [Aspergillus ruber CBS 135680]|uniref:Putative protease inhibitor n=1 Tax=Aspergillus ruber (strain CBS 135680) TaxID=1388766 RepID=A0A017S120_ASPRC|nr:putative protease inhibitor [Aspergillus ruber CBS 135680]EYE90521.1 putative protease inhibitor [Aspergillus ruber CBS 135680]
MRVCESVDPALSLCSRDPSKVLGVAVGSYKVTPGQFIPRGEAQGIPEISFSTATNANKTYLLVSIDLDGPFPSFSILSPILHWIQPSLHPAPSEDGTTTILKANAPFIANWIGPEPPPGSSPHRYVFLLYEQPEEFEVHRYTSEGGKEMGIWGRVRFDLDGFAREIGLGEVVAANYFLSN